MDTTFLSLPANRDRILNIIAALLVFLFIYTAVSKLTNFTEFQQQMKNQALPAWLSKLSIWSLPAMEILTALLLINQKTRHMGLWLCMILLMTFTAYIAYVLFGLAGRLPCSCGGVLKAMSWRTHLLFNIFFLLLSAIGIKLINRERRTPGKL